MGRMTERTRGRWEKDKGQASENKGEGEGGARRTWSKVEDFYIYLFSFFFSSLFL